MPPRFYPEEIASIVREANRALQIVYRDPNIPVSVLWDELDQETRDSAIDGVEHVLSGSTPEESHINWMKFKVDSGWVFGEVKDEVKKTHPLLIPYDELGEDDRIKDDLFVGIINILKDK